MGNEGATILAITTAAEPDGAPRVAGLDILRGIAILGILFMNIGEMGSSFFADGLNARHIGWSAADAIAWSAREVLADGTARCMLEMLFGAGMMILTDRAATAVGAAAERDGSALARAGRWLFGPWRVMRAYYWRNAVLFVFGVAHAALLLWPGDILHTYALAAMVAFLFRRLGPKTLLALGLVLTVTETVGSFSRMREAQASIAHVAELRAADAHGKLLTPADRQTIKAMDERRQRRAARRALAAQRIAADDRDRSPTTGTPASWAGAAWRTEGYFYFGIGAGGSSLEWQFVWEAASTMLIGAALFRWGILQGRRSRRFYLVLLAAGYAVGLGLRLGRTIEELRFADDPSLWYATFEVARLATTIGHLSLVWLLLGTAAGARLLQPFAAAGRTALSIYIGQTLICLWLLYPPFALGLYGKQGWAALMLTAAAINGLLLLLANWWVRRFSIAPVEWAWRSIVAGRPLPWRRADTARPGAAPLPA